MEDWKSPEDCFERLGGEALRQLVAATGRGKGGIAAKRRALVLFDCLLRIIDEPVLTSAISFVTERFRTLQALFYGALGSFRFVEATEATRIGYAYAFYCLMKELNEGLPVAFAPYRQGAAKEIPIELIEQFEDEDFDENEVKKLRPFLLHAKNGIEYNVLLSDLVPVLGTSYADAFHEGLRQIAKNKAKDSNLRDFGTTFSRFVAHLASEGKPISEELLKEPSYVDVFLIDFMEYHFLKFTRRKTPPNEGTLPSLQKQWSRYQLHWQALADRGIVVSPRHAFPEGKPGLLSNTEVGHRRVATNNDGTTSMVTAKLIIPVPLHLTDEEATLFLFEKLREEFRTIQSWLHQHLLDFFADAATGERLAASIDHLPPDKELTRIISKDSKSERAIALAVKCFQVRNGGYIDTSCFTNAVYPNSAARDGAPKALLSRYLGIPRRQEAMALMGYLASVDGRLSESALSACVIFDSNGLRINAVEVDTGLGLSVLKERHAGDGWHHVVLRDDAAEMVRHWVKHTEPLRNHMKKHGIFGWQNLIVYTGFPLGTPNHFDRSSNVNSFFRHFAMANTDRIGELARQVSIAKIRSTRGVLRFLETMDIQKMALELGNEADTSLRHYLPESLWEYFATRWLRIFQNLLIVEATRDTKYMQRALHFRSADEMDQFLRTHAIRPLLPKSTQSPSSRRSGPENPASEIMIAASPGIFATLLSIAEAGRIALECGRTLSGHGRYWKEFTERIQAHIESDAFHDTSIKRMLRQAAANIAPDNFMEAVCA
ncbi:hypothetical protein [Cupriavidus sp. PET2-C1]